MLRGEEEIEVRGALRAEVFYTDAKERAALGPGGPPRRATSAEDGAFANWAGWYETFVKQASYVLDAGWNRGSFNNRRELDAHLGERERIDYLLEHYPGPFADAAAADWERVRQCLLGERVELAAADLAYRDLGEKRRDEAREAARRARDASWRRSPPRPSRRSPPSTRSAGTAPRSPARWWCGPGSRPAAA